MVAEAKSTRVKHRFYLTIGAIFRDENPYFREWIAFHQSVGVDHFVLYNNCSTDASLETLRPYVDAGLVEIVDWPIPFHQRAVVKSYADCLDRVRGTTRWLALIDLDEFLFSPSDGTLPSVLAEFEFAPGIVVNWQNYGSAGHERMTDEPVTSRFQWRAHTNWIRNQRVKSIFDPERTVAPINGHVFRFEDDALAVNELKQRMRTTRYPTVKKRLFPLMRLLGPCLRCVDPYGTQGVASRCVSVDRLRINHYPIKSRQEFDRKAKLKQELQRYRFVDYFAYHDRNDVFDPILAEWSAVQVVSDD